MTDEATTVQALREELARARENEARLRERVANLETELRMFKAVVENTPDSVAVARMDGVHVYVNPAFRATFQIDKPVQDIVITDSVAPQEHQRLEQEVLPQILQHGTWIGRLMHNRADGTTFPVENTNFLIYDQEDRPEYIAVVLRDITERERSEAALSASRQSLQLIVDNIPQAIFWKDRNLVYQGCNRNFLHIINVATPEDVIGKTDYDMPWDADLAEKYRTDDQQVMETDTPVYNFEEPIQNPDGTRGWVRTSKVPLHDNDGSVIAVLGIFEDITEQKRTEEDLRTFKTLVEKSPDSIAVTTLEGIFAYANEAYGILTGYGSQLQGMPASVLSDPELVDIQAIMRQIFETGEFQGIVPVRRKDGSTCQAQASMFLLQDEAQQPKAIVGILRDISAQLEVEAERVALQQQVIDAQRTALRELSTPLIPIADDVVIMPLVGTIDSQRAQQVVETLLEGVAAHQAEMVILDITGVQVVDTQVANVFIRAAQAVRLLGARAMMTGIQPEIAQTLVQLGADLSGIITHGSLQSGIAYALGQSNGTQVEPSSLADL